MSSSIAEQLVNLYVIVSCSEKDSEAAFRRTYEAIVKQKNNPFNLSLIVWTSPKCHEDLVKFVSSLNGCHVVESSKSFLCDLPSSLSRLAQADKDKSSSYVLLCSCGVVPKENCFSPLKEKVLAEYTDDVLLTANGIRVFPHETTPHPHQQLREGTHWKLYDHTKTDRAVHIFTPEFCLVNTKLLENLSPYSDSHFSPLGHLWISFALGHFLHCSMWKIQLDAVVDLSDTPRPQLIPDKDSTSLFEEFYSHIVYCNWPPSISQPYHSTDKSQAVLQSKKRQPREVWKDGFGGVNMSAEPATELDFSAAATYGVTVVRIGAMCDAKDLAFLIDPKASTIEEDRAHFLKAVPRLRKILSKADENGLKVIITMTNLPGGMFHFHSEEDGTFPFWESSYSRTRAAKFWGLVAESLADMSSVVMGYDVINEPYTPEDRDAGFFDEMPLARADELNQFYSDVLKEIRLHDTEVAVIVKSTWFGSPRTFHILKPLPDPNVIYSFHMYAPHYLTLHRQFNTHTSTGSYPGHVPRWPYCSDPNVGTVEITSDYLRHLLETTIPCWQLRHVIPSNRILVAEFGISREVKGAQRYLEDLVALFKHFNWNWLLFSFRDEEWDAMDYELGTDMDNMLNRSPTPLFTAVANHFH